MRGDGGHETSEGVVTWFPPAALYSGRFEGSCDEINTTTLEEAVLARGVWPDYLPEGWVRERIGWMLTPSFWRETLPLGRASAALAWNGGDRALDATVVIAARVVHTTLGEEDTGTVRFPALVLFEIDVELNGRKAARKAVTSAVVRVPAADAVAM